MTDVVIVSAVRTALGRLGGSLRDVQPDDPRQAGDRGGRRARPGRAGRSRRGHHRPDQAERRRGQPGPCSGAESRLPGRGPGVHRHAPVWVGAAGGAQCRAGHTRRRGRDRRRRRRREHEPRPVLPARRPLRLSVREHGRRRLEHRKSAPVAALRGVRRSHHGADRREPRRARRHHTRRTGRLCAAQPGACLNSHRVRALRGRDRAGGGPGEERAGDRFCRRRVPAPYQSRAARRASRSSNRVVPSRPATPPAATTGLPASC